MYDVTHRRVRVTVAAVEKQLHIQSVYFIAIGTQHAMRMQPYCHLLALPVVQYFSTFSENGTIFGK
jgi:hypothetical protein